MSLVHARSWNSWNNTSSSSNYGSQRKISVPSPLSYSWTSDGATTTPVKQSLSSWENRQRCQKSKPVSCGVCRRPRCQLRSHGAYISTRESRSKYTVPQPGTTDKLLYDAKPKTVDDSIIRAAFTRSYAFVEPSCLSILQPSSFRLDVFHDLPITGGDRPETHKVIWEFLAHQLQNLLEEQLHSEVTIDHLQRDCLESVMTDPIVCLCVFATKRILKVRTAGQIQDEHTTTSIRASEKYLEWLKQQFESEDQEGHALNPIIAMCLRLVQPSNNTSYWPGHQSQLLLSLDEVMDLKQNDHSSNEIGLLKLDSAVAR